MYALVWFPKRVAIVIGNDMYAVPAAVVNDVEKGSGEYTIIWSDSSNDWKWRDVTEKRRTSAPASILNFALSIRSHRIGT